MEGVGGVVSSDKQQQENAAVAAAEGGDTASSYRYWVRQVTGDAAPLPVPRKLTSPDQQSQPSTHLGSAWNRAGTWEEKNLNKWASDRIKELLVSMALEFSGGRAEIAEVSRCVGDAFLVIVRNKKRVGYTYELTLRVQGEWRIGDEGKSVKGDIDVPEFSFGELDDLQIEVRLREAKDLPHRDKMRISQDLKSFLQPLREKLVQFEEELRDR
ncbi:hypothetical protein RJ640_025547 [Escallonia rubra]|uniref:Activator of Hsp90 ATPase AHSA1-like N-terminal domain-containing protein n=1 Tax=Escallonia rubra TaxID=112253 RepID=A0AA88QZ31_9ASTE|nr:hypothetical protein RJ640_025547 [Escallonia rubra]